MITIRRGDERRHSRRRWQEAWQTFYARDGPDLFGGGFGSLEFLDEVRLAPGADVQSHPRHSAEIVTYVFEGALAYEDSTGASGVLPAGEFRRMTAGRGIRHGEKNASRTDPAHFFQIWLRPSEVGLAPAQEQKRFTAAERRGLLCVIASSDGRRGSLHVRLEALVFSAMLDPGQHVVHELPPGRRGWLHVVQGEVCLGDFVLGTGDGAGVTGERVVSFRAQERAEILLLDVDDPPRKRARGRRPEGTQSEADAAAPPPPRRPPIIP